MFEGFTPETIDFLWGIRFNNNRAWFLEHKNIYERTLYRPMLALAEDVFVPFREIPGTICKVSRIYRDARYAHGVPYKESLWFCIRRDVESWSAHPALFFQIEPDCYNYGFLLLNPAPSAMAAFRSGLQDRPDAFPELVRQVEAASGEVVTGRAYARQKPGAPAQCTKWYNMKSIQAYTDHPVDELLYSPELVPAVQQTLLGLLPLYEYCQGFAG